MHWGEERGEGALSAFRKRVKSQASLERGKAGPFKKKERPAIQGKRLPVKVPAGKEGEDKNFRSPQERGQR